LKSKGKTEGPRNPKTGKAIEKGVYGWELKRRPDLCTRFSDGTKTHKTPKKKKNKKTDKKYERDLPRQRSKTIKPNTELVEGHR